MRFRIKFWYNYNIESEAKNNIIGYLTAHWMKCLTEHFLLWFCGLTRSSQVCTVR